MSNLLRSLGIPSSNPTRSPTWIRAPTRRHWNALSRGNPEIERILDQRIAFTSMAALLHEEFLIGRESLVVAGTHGKPPRQACSRGSTSSLLNPQHRKLDPGAIVSDWWSRGKLPEQLSAAPDAHLHSRRRRVRYSLL